MHPAFIPAGYNGVENQKRRATLTSKNIKTITLLKTIGNRKLNLNQIKSKVGKNIAFIPAGYNGVKNQKTAGAILTSKNIKTITLLKTIGNRKLNLNQIKSKVGKNIAVRFLNLFF